jgi:phage baseplate assembly protein W
MTDYGSDFSCVADFDATMSVVTGPLVVAQAVARRLETPRGGLWYDPNYGTDLRQYLNGHPPPFRIRTAIEAEALKDERVERVSAEVTVFTDHIKAVVSLQLADGPFTLTVAASDLTVEMTDFRQG